MNTNADSPSFHACEAANNVLSEVGHYFEYGALIHHLPKTVTVSLLRLADYI